MLEPLRNPANWDNFRKAAVLVLIIWAAASVLFGIIYFFILGGRSPAPANIFRALILLVPFIAIAPVARPTGSNSRTRRHLQSGGKRRRIGRNDPLGTFGAEEGLDAHAQHWAKDVQEVVAAQSPTEMARLERGDRFLDPSVNAIDRTDGTKRQER